MATIISGIRTCNQLISVKKKKKKMVQGKLSVAYVCGAEHWQPSNKLYIVDLSESGCLDCSLGLLGNRF